MLHFYEIYNSKDDDNIVILIYEFDHLKLKIRVYDDDESLITIMRGMKKISNFSF